MDDPLIFPLLLKKVEAVMGNSELRGPLRHFVFFILLLVTNVFIRLFFHPCCVLFAPIPSLKCPFRQLWVAKVLIFSSLFQKFMKHYDARQICLLCVSEY